jgi:predicted alpha-1,2-mannosidase
MSSPPTSIQPPIQKEVFMQMLSLISKPLLIPTALVLCLSVSIASAAQSKQPIDYVNGLVGTAPLDKQSLIGNAPPPGELLYSGFTSPGAALPQSEVRLSPINENLDLMYPAGVRSRYYYPNRMIYGFSTEVDEDGPILMPMVGNWTVPPERSASVYDKSREISSPGYYSVYLDDFHTRAEMTVTQWTGLFRFTYPASKKAHVILDLGRSGGNVEVMNDHTVRGHMSDGRYFVAEFSRSFAAFGVFRQVPPKNDNYPLLGFSDVKPDETHISGNFAGAYLRFVTTQNEQVMVKVATGVSYQQARQRLKKEDPGWDFDDLHAAARAAWASKLDRVRVEGGTAKQKMLFYSCLYHSFDSPRLVAGRGEQFIGSDGKIHTAEHDRYGEIPFWDTGRNQVVLLMMLEPKIMSEILRSQLDMAREHGYMGTSFHGDHADLVYLGAWERGIQFNHEAVYQYLYKNATDPNGPRPYLAEYEKQGWISDYIPKGNPDPPYAGGKAGVATTLEYSWDDHALALYAKRLGKQADYQRFLRRAHNYKNVFDPQDGFMRGRLASGQWITPFDPQEPYYNFMMKEASGWGTLWLVPHDVQGLMNLLGGRKKFDAKLDQFFSIPYHPQGICRDCTGVIGQYVQGNQPDQQAAYYYDWGGEPWKTQRLTREILRLMYGSDSSGYAFPGMDDQGSTSSWYVMSAMGFYPVDPSSPDYILGSPIFRKVSIMMGNGHTLVIVARHNSPENMYIQSATLNGKPWDKPWFSWNDIRNGAVLTLTMGPHPNREWGTAPSDAPPSMSSSASTK